MATTYTLTLADGTTINNLTLNGETFESATEIDESVFDYNLSPVTITCGSEEEVHENMELLNFMKFGDKWWIVLRDIPEDTLAQMKMESDIAYLAMMQGIDLDEED